MKTHFCWLEWVHELQVHFPPVTAPKVDEKMKMLREQMEYDKRLVTAAIAGTRLGSQKMTMDVNVT